MSSTKKSKDIGEHSYKLGDVVLAKVRGFPQWPGRVVDPDTVPPGVAKERPTSKKTTLYCVQFFPAGDYSWTVSKDLSLLQKHEIEAYINEPHKKSGELLQGYKVALNPAKWEEALAEERAAADEVEASAEIDELEDAEEEDETDTKKNKTGRKRKRESEPKPKKKKEPKKGTLAGADSKKTAAKKKSGKKNGIRSKETIESEDDGGHDAEGEDVHGESSNKRSGPAAKKARKDKGGDGGNLDHLANNPDAIKVKEWRHKLQRAFLNKSVPKPEEMREYDELFTTIENHELTIDQLQFSKLGKVMRHIAQLKFPIPNEDEFSIQKRAMVLLDKWQGLITASGGEGVPSTVNGAGSAAKTIAEKNDDPGKDAPLNGNLPEVNVADRPTEESAAPAVEEAVAMDTADE